METVKLKLTQKEEASRVELLVRLVYWIPLVIINAVLGIISWVIWILNILSILFIGKRLVSLNKFVEMYLRYQLRMNAYYLLLTDERPPIVPEEKE
ncbi:DUF4389 domain-containing protein [Candidatus Micrarchaeota archaeon]|nr:DUF4389 domain-containing protein [Candidatus Micrarchaeota archaeon]MBU1930636.1 DUF4389 domain-containing protein [Candidatus Micrarchaeota archaeon]